MLNTILELALLVVACAAVFLALRLGSSRK
jgi:hypothetical protein